MNKMTIRVISSESFDKLPYKYSHEALGVADVKEGVAYIRDLGSVEATQAVMEHEIGELENLFGSMDEPLDEPGIKYKNIFKKIGDFAKDTVQHWDSWVPQVAGGVLTLAGMPYLGAGVAGIGSGVSNYQDTGSYGKAALAGGVGALTANMGAGALKGGIEGAKAAGPGLFAKAGGAASGAYTGSTQFLPGFGAGGKFAGPLTAGAAKTGNLALSGGAALPGATGSTLYGGAAPASGYVGGIGAGANPAVSAGLPGMGQVAAAPGGINMGKTLAGFAVPMIGNAMVGTPEVPDISGITNSLKTSADGSISPIGSLGIEKLTSRLNTQPGSLPEEYKNAQLANFDESYNQAKDNLVSQYKALRPGADIETDSAFRQDMMKLENDFAKQKTNLLANLEYQNQQSQLTQQAADIQTALGVDTNTFNKYAEIAQLDLDKIMLEYGVDYATASQFKSIFADFGSLLAQKGLGLDKLQF